MFKRFVRRYLLDFVVFLIVIRHGFIERRQVKLGLRKVARQMKRELDGANFAKAALIYRAIDDYKRYQVYRPLWRLWLVEHRKGKA